ncbi:MAG: GntR family transcriptional regulator [Clostridia bacterium]|nr:GntR family transcriptional regulator [Clostridia bacterium]
MYRIDLLSRVPIYEQIISQTEKYIITGVLKPGDALPSVRGLSLSLHANPNTVQRAFTELERRGLISTFQGKGCFIRPDAKDVLSDKARQRLGEVKELCQELIAAGVSRDEIIREINNITLDNETKGVN